MLQFSTGKLFSILAVLLIGFMLALPNALPNTFMGVEPKPVTVEDPEKLRKYREDVEKAKQSWWPGFFPDKKVNLGLDLQGGVYLLIELDPDEVVENQMTNAMADVNSAFTGKRPQVFSDRSVLPGGKVRIKLKDSAQTEEALKRIKTVNVPIENTIAGALTFDVTDDGNGLITMQLSNAARENFITRAQARAITIISRRVDPNGVSEITVVPQGENRIILEAPGEPDPQRLKDLLSQAGRMTFNLVSDDVTALRAAVEGRIRPSYQLLYDEVGTPYLVDRAPKILGDEIANAAQGNDPDDNSPVVNFRLTNKGSRKFGNVTAENINRQFAIVLDDKVMSAPNIREPIWGGNVQISGRFTIQEATDLAAIIEAGELPAKLQFISVKTVTATLGEDSIRAGTTASIIGLILVAVFMILAYSRLGIYAVLSLAINIILILGALSAVGATLTLPGIAGIILTIGMAVDANVLVFERIREESRAGRGAMSSVQAGYEKALTTILDANITTFIAAAILYLLGSGPVKGFAVTLAYGIITSVFTAFVVTRLFTALWLNRAKPKTLKL